MSAMDSVLNDVLNSGKHYESEDIDEFGNEMVEC